MKPMILLAHITLDGLFGWSLLNFHPNRRTFAESLLMAVLLGMYLETITAAILMFAGASLTAAAIATGLMMITIAAAMFHRNIRHFPRLSIDRLKWYECLALAAIAEKILFILWQLTRTDTYFDDAFQHWSGRARSLYGEVNWSFDAASPFFLGKHIGNYNYPLLTVLWRALSAKWSGEWNEVISRADGLIFFIVIVGTMWTATRRFSNLPWLPAAAAFVVSAVPLLAWHAAAGYSDIAVEAFVLVAFAALLRGEWLTSGLMAAGAVWSKNDGLILYFPSILVAVLMMQFRQQPGDAKWRSVGLFLLGFATVAPWLIFNYAHSLGISPGQQTTAWHSDAPLWIWKALTRSPSSSILWIVILPCAIYCSLHMFRDKLGRPLIFAFGVALSAIVFVFTSTSAYSFLVDESTIHRTLMQFSGMAILISAYGASLKLNQ